MKIVDEVSTAVVARGVGTSIFTACWWCDTLGTWVLVHFAGFCILYHSRGVVTVLRTLNDPLKSKLLGGSRTAISFDGD